jgi:hypothetical protein
MELYIITSSLISIFAVFFVMKYVIGSDANKRHVILQNQNTSALAGSNHHSNDTLHHPKLAIPKVYIRLI